MTAADKAQRFLERTDERSCRAAKLAALASPAPFIEPELLRAIRLHVLPQYDPSVEADLWFSPLVSTRGPGGITLQRSVVTQLHTQLQQLVSGADSTNPALDLGGIMARVHASSPPLRRVQEQVTWWAITPDPTARAQIESELERVLAAMQDDSRRQDVAQWCSRVLGRLPEPAQSTNAWRLAVAASAITGQDAGLTSEVPTDLLDSGLDELLETSDMHELPILRTGGQIQIGQVDAPSAFSIRVPATKPYVLGLRWPQTGHTETVKLESGQVARLPDFASPVVIRTLNGLVYQLEAEAEADESTSPQPASVTIEMLPAGAGDCLWIEYGRGDSTHHVLLDGGERRTGDSLDDRIGTKPDLRFELIVASHVDSAAIGGLTALLSHSDMPIVASDVWFNGAGQIADAAAGAVGPRSGSYLDALIADRDLPHNQLFNGTAIHVPESGELPRVALDGGATITILGPRLDDLRRLEKQWNKVVETEERDEDIIDTPPTARSGQSGSIDITPPPRVAPGKLTTADVEDLAGSKSRPDGSIANASAIIMLFEYEACRMLLASDAPDRQLSEGIGRYLRETGESKLRVDAMVLPHHGSKRNTSVELLEMLECDRFLVSTDGSKFAHPDRETIARVLMHSPQPKIYFNHDVPTTALWDQPELQYALDYTTLYPPPGESGLVVQTLGGPEQPVERVLNVRLQVDGTVQQSFVAGWVNEVVLWLAQPGWSEVEAAPSPLGTFTRKTVDVYFDDAETITASSVELPTDPADASTSVVFEAFPPPLPGEEHGIRIVVHDPDTNAILAAVTMTGPVQEPEADSSDKQLRIVDARGVFDPYEIVRDYRESEEAAPPNVGTIIVDELNYDSEKIMTEFDEVTMAHAIDSLELSAAVIRLARLGAQLRADFPEFEELRETNAIDIVYGPRSSFTPFELIYDGPYPSSAAALCDVWHRSPDGPCPRCDAPGGPDADTVCPLQFWSMKKQIQRIALAGDPQIDVRPEFPRPHPLTSILFSASERMPGDQADKLVDALTVHSSRVQYATSWNEWIQAAREEPPSLLITIPFRARSDGMWWSWEIGGDEIDEPAVESIAQSSTNSAPPIAMVFGENAGGTASDTHRSILAATFIQAGTPAVVSNFGRLTTSEASGAVAGLVEELARATDAAENTLGAVLAKARRRLLADANLMGLRIVQYGDASWSPE